MSADDSTISTDPARLDLDGFTRFGEPDRWMERSDRGVYGRSSA